MQSSLSIIIPVLNEEAVLPTLLDNLQKERNKSAFEVIVVDGGSNDKTVEIARTYDFVHLISSESPGRSVQMNKGAIKAVSEVLYFLHADCLPPSGFCRLIKEFLASGYDFGYFSYRFDERSNSLLKHNEKGTRRKNLFSGGGDQGLFIKKEIFEEAGGFDEKLPIMEDFELHSRLKKKWKYNIIQENAIVSSRKYKLNGYWRVQWVNLLIFCGFYLGLSPVFLKKTYKSLLRFD